MPAFSPGDRGNVVEQSVHSRTPALLRFLVTLPSVDARGRWKERGNPFRTEEWTEYVGSRLVAVSYVDALRHALSAIYCYHDPVDRARSLGTFNILSLVAAARERGLPHV